MAICSAAVRTTNFTTNQASMELIAAANNAYKAMESGISLATATASVYGVGAPAAIGISPTSPAALVFEDGGNTATPATTTALAWGTSPTNPTVFQRRIGFPATLGAGCCFTFPRGYAILKAKSLAWQNVGTTVAADIWWVIDE